MGRLYSLPSKDVRLLTYIHLSLFQMLKMPLLIVLQCLALMVFLHILLF